MSVFFDTYAARQIELAVSQLDSISTLPSAVVHFFSKMLRSEILTSDMDEIIESNPALSAMVFSLAKQKNIRIDEKKFSLRKIIDEIPAHCLCQAMLSIQIKENDDESCMPQKEMLLYSLAVAALAKNIANAVGANPELAYSAGLLHNVGNFALKEIMPKSFEITAKEAKAQQISIRTIQQQHIGTDYAIIGKRLGQKWHFPDEITLAIWLHDSKADSMWKNLPEAKIAQIVHLACSLANESNVGLSGNYDNPDINELAKLLEIHNGQLEQIRHKLSSEIEHKSEVLGLNAKKTKKAYHNIIHKTALQLAKKNDKLLTEHNELRNTSSQLDFIENFLLAVTPTDSITEIAKIFTTQWQKLFYTGPVCLWLNDDTQHPIAVTANSSSDVQIAMLNMPKTVPANKSAVPADREQYSWLFEQLKADFNPEQIKIMPLVCNEKNIGGIVFESHYTLDSKQLQSKFNAIIATASAIFDMIISFQKQIKFVEKFSQIITTKEKTESVKEYESIENKNDINDEKQHEELLTGLAEMAAGAAHELNNPLLIISGRAQLLEKSETDTEKKRILGQIKKNANELSEIIDDLMSFAQPRQTRPNTTSVEQIFEESVQLTLQKRKAEFEINHNVSSDIKNVFVDSAQIVSALANIILNAVESYNEQEGSVKLTAENSDNGVILQIQDNGCGMNEETIEKATHPFFSAKPACRKRGMGLAHANRLIQLNKGTLKITSQDGEGTTVTITLPYSETI